MSMLVHLVHLQQTGVLVAIVLDHVVVHLDSDAAQGTASGLTRTLLSQHQQQVIEEEITLSGSA